MIVVLLLLVLQLLRRLLLLELLCAVRLVACMVGRDGVWLRHHGVVGQEEIQSTP